jgi:glycosyltransferase involved in cell wall biosynthesis
MTGAIATLGRPRTRLVWNLRCSDVWLRPGSRVIRKACAAIADRAPDAIIACGERAADYHRTLGYPAKAMTVIPNGYHFPALEETQALRARRRSERTQGPLLVGAVGRYDRAKGYGFLLRAIALLRAQGRNVQLAIAGRGCDPANTVLVEEIARHGLTGLVDARGELEDLRSFFAELDIFCLSSVSEGFPNALCEAIAEATPAVATDVGDAAHIMGPDGTVPPASAEMLAAAIARLLDMPGELREARATAAARRVRQTYSLDHIADLYYAVYRSVIDNADAALA